MSGAVDISIAVAAVNSAGTLGPWLDAVRPQASRHRVEVLLAAAADDDSVTVDPADTFIRVIRGEAGALVPVLWGAALLEARGPIVAVTITACVPAADWLDAIAAAHRASPADGIGGTIDPSPRGSLVDRALHLVRYTPYLPPVGAGPVAEIAGDNGTYASTALDRWRATIAREGFWESEFNREIRAAGGTLRIEPSIRVTHTRSYTFRGFSRQRFRHGRLFGRARRSGLSAGGRIVKAALAPTVPAIMFARAMRTCAARGRLDVRTVLAAPLAVWFFCCWAAGEAAGLLRG
jgi:hypothetical protein